MTSRDTLLRLAEFEEALAKQIEHDARDDHAAVDEFRYTSGRMAIAACLRRANALRYMAETVE